MSVSPRQLPGQPSVRFLKIEAKRRLAAGEFETLHEAQLAIAREHGLPSWAALKEHIESASHALAQVRWIMSRFATADTPQWTAPDEAELRLHFDDRYLGLVPQDWLTRLFGTLARQLRQDLADVQAGPQSLRARLADLRVEAATETQPPHRLSMLRFYPLETRVEDPRVAAPATRDCGAVPEDAAAVAEESFTELGLVGLIVAGTTADGEVWATARGWANLDDGDVLLPEHRFPAYAVTKLVTATAVLRLVADGRIRLDEPVNGHQQTVRELLSHTGGVNDGKESMFADHVPEVVEAAKFAGQRGTFAYGHSGYAMLGRLIEDLTGLSYPQAAANLVLDPLGMTKSSFPTTPPTTEVATGYRLNDKGSFEPVPAKVFTVPAAGGLWTTALDLVRFGRGWSSLLPETLVREALSPQAERDDFGGRAGLGWMLMLPKDVAGHPGAGSGVSASLIIRPSTGRPWVVLTNRQVLVEPINERLALPIT